MTLTNPYATLMSMIFQNLTKIQKEIDTVCRQLGRNPEEITLVGVSKNAEADKIKEAVNAGLKHIAENRVQEGERKFPILEKLNNKLTRHLIGHLQTNKVKSALEWFDVIQSVDSLKLALEIEKHASALNRIVDVLVQVSTSGEEQKFGIPTDKADDLVKAVGGFMHLRVKGLMTVAPLTDDEKVLRQVFGDLRKLFDHFKSAYTHHDHIDMKYLSMGMSGDFRIALEEGSNMLRIGTAIFHV